MSLLVCNDCGLQLTPKALLLHQEHHHCREIFYVLIVERVLWLRQGSKPINNRHIHQRTHVTCAIKYLPTIQNLVIILELFTKRRKLSARSVLRRMTLHLKIQFNEYLEIKLSLYSGANIFRIGSVFCGPFFVHDVEMCSYFFLLLHPGDMC